MNNRWARISHLLYWEFSLVVYTYGFLLGSGSNDKSTVRLLSFPDTFKSGPSTGIHIVLLYNKFDEHSASYSSSCDTYRLHPAFRTSNTPNVQALRGYGMATFHNNAEAQWFHFEATKVRSNITSKVQL